MSEILATICTAGSNKLFWRAVVHQLDQLPDISVQEVREREQLVNVVAGTGSGILMLESSAEAFTQDSSRLLEANPGVIVIGIDPEGVDTFIHLRDAGLEFIARIIRSVDQDRLTADGSAERGRFIGPRELRAHFGFSQTAFANNSHEGAPRWPHYQAANEPVHEWLTVCLHQLLLVEDDVERRMQLQNLPVNAAGLRQLLEVDAKLDAAALQDKRRRLESRLNSGDSAAEYRLDGKDSAVQWLSLTGRWQRLCRVFKLERHDRYLLLLALAPEVDGRFARVFGFLNDDYARRRPTPTIAGRILSPDNSLAANVVMRLLDRSRISHFNLVSFDNDDLTPVAERALIAPDDIVTAAAAELPEDEDIAAGVRLLRGDDEAFTGRSTEKLRARILAWRKLASQGEERPAAIHVGADEAVAMWLRHGLAAAGCDVVSLSLASNGDAAADHAAALCAARVATLYGAAVFATFSASSPARPANGRAQAVLKTLRERVSLLIVQGAPATHIGRVWTLKRDEPGTSDRAAIWQDSAASLGLELPAENAEAMARTCRFLEPGIHAALNLCGPYCHDLELLQASVRQVARVNLPSAVRYIEATYDWGDIVLPPTVLSTLKSIPAHVRHAQEVLDEWGFRSRVPYGHGVAALFAGPSGTGKTMAAQIIARELGVPLLKVDLSQTVSKYIGDTEKNLSAVFDAAESASAVLFVDECDALFGKRTEVQDAHDRYANVEVAYLLQRIEEYGGIAILTTNLKQNIDNAFMRRLRFICDFTMPTAELRARIWRLAFPENAPLAADVSFDFLARRLELNGGYIQKIALNAAFNAVDDGGIISNQHILDAVREELTRLGVSNADKKLAGAVA